jgi:hypothetical protein
MVHMASVRILLGSMQGFWALAVAGAVRWQFISKGRKASVVRRIFMA